MGNKMVLAGSRLDIEKASIDDLKREVLKARRAAIEGWLDKVYQVNVRLSSTQGHIYQIRGKGPWALMGSGFDSINRAAGVTVMTVDEAITWDGIMPKTIHIKRVAVGLTPAGTIRATPVTLELHSKHYRFERIRIAASKWDSSASCNRPVPGFDFGVKAALLEAEKLGKSHQIWLATESIGDAELGYALDTTQHSVRAVLEDGATFAKNLSRAATTIAGRLASKQWWGFDKLDPAWITEQGKNATAVVPITGYRNNLTVEQMADVCEGRDLDDVVVDRKPFFASQPVLDDEEDQEVDQTIEDVSQNDTADQNDTVEQNETSSEQLTQDEIDKNLEQLLVVIRKRSAAINSGDYGNPTFREVIADIGEDCGLTSQKKIKECQDPQQLIELDRLLAHYMGEI